MVGGEEAAAVLLGNGIEAGGGKVAGTIWGEFTANAAELATCTPHGEEAGAFAFQEEDDGSQRIEPEAEEKDAAQTAIGHVLIQQ